MSIKFNRAWEKAGIPDMPMVRRHILQNLKKVDANIDKLSSTELAYIIKALHIGYKDAQGRQQADYMSDMDCVWVGGDVQKMIPVKALQNLEIKEMREAPELTAEEKEMCDKLRFLQSQGIIKLPDGTILHERCSGGGYKEAYLSAINKEPKKYTKYTLDFAERF